MGIDPDMHVCFQETCANLEKFTSLDNQRQSTNDPIHANDAGGEVKNIKIHDFLQLKEGKTFLAM